MLGLGITLLLLALPAGLAVRLAYVRKLGALRLLFATLGALGGEFAALALMYYTNGPPLGVRAEVALLLAGIGLGPGAGIVLADFRHSRACGPDVCLYGLLAATLLFFAAQAKPLLVLLSPLAGLVVPLAALLVWAARTAPSEPSRPA
jgi:hypothetical protein